MSEALKHDLAGFIERHLRLPMTGAIRLSPVQREFCQRAMEREGDGWRFKQVWACWPKRSSKSLMVACAIVHRLYAWEGSRSLVLGPSEAQGRSVVFARVVDLLSPS